MDESVSGRAHPSDLEGVGGAGVESSIASLAAQGFENLSKGDMAGGSALIERALRDDAMSGAAFFGDQANRAKYLPPLEKAYVQEAQELRSHGVPASVVALGREKLRLFDHLPGKLLPALRVEVAAAYAVGNQPRRALEYYRDAIVAEILCDMDRDAVRVGERALALLVEEQKIARSGAFLLLGLCAIGVLCSVVWLVPRLPRYLPYLILVPVLYYFGHHCYRLVRMHGWATRVAVVGALSAAFGTGMPILVVTLLKSTPTMVLVLLGLAVTATVCGTALELYAYKTARSSDSPGRPFAEMKAEFMKHLHFLRRGIRRLVADIAEPLTQKDRTSSAAGSNRPETQ